MFSHLRDAFRARVEHWAGRSRRTTRTSYNTRRMRASFRVLCRPSDEAWTTSNPRSKSERRVFFSLLIARQAKDALGRLRQKIRVPYRALQANVTRLQRIQQANDALRRAARFAVLAKRLEAQMSELGGYANAGGGREKRAGVGANGPAGDHQEDKERTIAKAALSIAELSACCVFWLQRLGVLTGSRCIARRTRRGSSRGDTRSS